MEHPASFYQYLFNKPSAIAQDEKPKTLAEHDKQFHPDGYDPKTDSCELRDKLSAEAEPDNLKKDFKSLKKENEDIRSYTTSAVKKGSKWTEQKTDAKGKSTKDDHDKFGKKGKHDKWAALPPPESEKEKTPMPYFDSFANVPKIDAENLSAIHPSELYSRGKETNLGEGKPAYEWKRNGAPVPEDEAYRLEMAMKEKGYSQTLNPKNTDIKVRPDICNQSGQMATWRNSEGDLGIAYGDAKRVQADREMASRVNTLYKVYDEIKKRIYKGVEEDNPMAWLAYFCLRTKVRVGSENNPSKGKGARNLERGDIQLSNDGETFYLSFNAKSRQWWHVTAKDKVLYDYLQQRKKNLSGAGANSTPIFDIPYDKFKEYLKSISEDLTGDPEVYMKPHDFRRLGATRVAEESLRESLKGVDPKKDRKKWEDRICRAVVAAAQHLNDTPKVAFDTYILPNIIFNSSPEDIKRYFPYMEGLDLK